MSISMVKTTRKTKSTHWAGLHGTRSLRLHELRGGACSDSSHRLFAHSETLYASRGSASSIFMSTGSENSCEARAGAWRVRPVLGAVGSRPARPTAPRADPAPGSPDPPPARTVIVTQLTPIRINTNRSNHSHSTSPMHWRRGELSRSKQNNTCGEGCARLVSHCRLPGMARRSVTSTEGAHRRTVLIDVADLLGFQGCLDLRQQKLEFLGGPRLHFLHFRNRETRPSSLHQVMLHDQAQDFVVPCRPPELVPVLSAVHAVVERNPASHRRAPRLTVAVARR